MPLALSPTSKHEREYVFVAAALAAKPALYL